MLTFDPLDQNYPILDVCDTGSRLPLRHIKHTLVHLDEHKHRYTETMFFNLMLYIQNDTSRYSRFFKIPSSTVK